MNPWMRLIFLVTLLAVTLLVSCAAGQNRRHFEAPTPCSERRALCGPI